MVSRTGAAMDRGMTTMPMRARDEKSDPENT